MEPSTSSNDARSPAPPESAFPRTLVAALALSSMLTPLNSTMLSVVLPRIGRALSAPEALLTQALVTSYLITSVVAQAPGGRLGDRVGYRRTVAIGQTGFAVASLLATLAPSFVALTCARVLMAMSGALIVPSASALLRLEVPAHARGRAFGTFGASMALSAAMGPVVGDAIASRTSWRAIFLVNLIVLAIAAVLARLGQDRARTEVAAASPSTATPGFDGVGALLLGASLAALVVGARLAGTTRLVVLGLGALALFVFVAWERRHPSPVVDLRLFRQPVFVAGGLVVALHNLPMYALLFELPSLVTKVFGPEARGTGRLLGSMMLAMVVVSPLAGRLADRVGARRVAVTGCLFALLGAGVMYVTTLDSQLALVPSLVLLGVGLGLASSPAQAAAMGAAPREASGSAAAVLATMRYVGGIVGMIVLGLVWSASDDAVTALAEHHRALALFGISLVGALACAALLPSRDS